MAARGLLSIRGLIDSYHAERLPPVPFHEHPSATTMHPMVANPYGVFARRPIIVAGHPHVAIAVPAMISVHPDISALRCGPAVFLYLMGWPFMNIDLRK